MDDSLVPVLTAAAAFAATFTAQERRRARATGLALRMALVGVIAVTEHEARLFSTRAMGHPIGNHVMAVPYDKIAKVTIGKKVLLCFR